jgi:hypothetical protein
MSAEARKYFRHLDLVREDIREELDIVGIKPTNLRICDYGCGNGITTFGLAIEAKGSECIGVDLFGKDSKIGINEIDQIIKNVSNKTAEKDKHFSEAYELIKTNRVPMFRQGNIVKNINLPTDIELAYCKKLLVNIFAKEYEGIPSGENGLIAGLRSIYQSLRSDGLLCAIEYFDDFTLREYFEQCGFQLELREQIKRNEIRSKGRTNVVSSMTLYLCRKRKALPTPA